MKRAAIILHLLLIIIISCNTGNEKKVKPVSNKEKTNIADTGIISKKESDNFLIDNTSNQDNGPVYMYCEKMPEFPGGEAAFFDYVMKNVKYPAGAVSDKIEGRVVVKFIIRSDGEPGDVKIFRSIRSDLDSECLRVISRMPKWKPGMINEKPVSVSYSIPVRFLLKKSEILNGIFILPGNGNSAPKPNKIP